MEKILFTFIAILILQNNIVFSQTEISNSVDTVQYKYEPGFLKIKENYEISVSSGSVSDDPDGGFVLGFMAYLINPVLSIEDGKAAWGWTKEVSLGFGRLGEYRTSVEYTYSDREHLKNIIRAGLKYDIFLKKKINPDDDPVSTSVFTIGGGYYTDFEHSGYFPELSYGYSMRNDKFLMYPSVKMRYTFVNESPDILDISFGMVIGFANPFIDYEHKKKLK